uniref:Peptidyl-prolyl cis-trans isomerase n=1 Tax=Chaetoceros debilis TaxID=122233 RepID=A0A7S3VFU9_9STRA|mmetsp:Transcript_5711/g.8452  ORF Transcript_5711/g.8452 Transcript_5711/m.8452 type:complete len:265 (+) Transcript_5711:50-844(+)
MNSAAAASTVSKCIRALSKNCASANRHMSTGARGARGHGWLHKYRAGLGGRHLQGRYHKRDNAKLAAVNEEVFALNDSVNGSKKAYLDFEVEDEKAKGGDSPTIQRVTIELATAALPKTCQNFLALCQKEDEGNLTYEGSKVFKIEPKVGICLGDVTENNDGLQGSCHSSSNGSTDSPYSFEHESVVLSHAQKGMISMLSTGLDRNDSRFVITTVDDAPHLDGKYVAFGRVSEGIELLEDLVKNTYTKKGMPGVNIKVAKCGIL